MASGSDWTRQSVHAPVHQKQATKAESGAGDPGTQRGSTATGISSCCQTQGSSELHEVVSSWMFVEMASRKSGLPAASRFAALKVDNLPSSDDDDDGFQMVKAKKTNKAAPASAPPSSAALKNAKKRARKKRNAETSQAPADVGGRVKFHSGTLRCVPEDLYCT